MKKPINPEAHKPKIITPSWILPIAPQHVVLENHSIVIEDDRIIDLSPTVEATNNYPQATHLQLEHHLLMPGLINMHTHLPMNLYRGIADDLPLMTWLNDFIWPAEHQTMNENSAFLGYQLAIAECIRSGVTCFNDHYFFSDMGAKAVLESGIRARLGIISIDTENAWGKGCQQMLARGERAMNAADDNPRLRWALAPHSPYMLNDQQLQSVKQLATTHQLPIHIHLHETEQEIKHNLQHYGMRPIARLQQLGLLNEQLIAVHMVHLSDEEIDQIAKAGVQVVHCPESNLKLGSGIMPYRNLSAAGINICLGTDGAVSNNDLDLLTEARTAALIHKGVQQQPTLLSAAEALKMMTQNAAKALHWEKDIGTLEVGKQADLISIDLNTLNSQPLYDPMSQLIYACQSHQVQNVWVAGKQLLENGQLTTLDVNTLLAKSQAFAKKIKTILAKSFKK